jgi:hypothetical protein
MFEKYWEKSPSPNHEVWRLYIDRVIGLHLAIERNRYGTEWKALVMAGDGLLTEQRNAGHTRDGAVRAAVALFYGWITSLEESITEIGYSADWLRGDNWYNVIAIEKGPGGRRLAIDKPETLSSAIDLAEQYDNRGLDYEKIIVKRQPDNVIVWDSTEQRGMQ